MKTQTALQGVFISLCFCSFSVFANQFDHSNGTCSEKFVGTVVSVNAKSPFTTPEAKSEVIFNVDHSYDGAYSFKRSIEVDMKKHLFKKGESYLLEVADNDICNIQYISRR